MRWMFFFQSTRLQQICREVGFKAPFGTKKEMVDRLVAAQEKRTGRTGMSFYKLFSSMASCTGELNASSYCYNGIA